MNAKQLMFPQRCARVHTTLDRVLFVDPGLGGTGWAFFPVVKVDATKSPKMPEQFGVIHVKSKKDVERCWQSIAEEISQTFAGIIAALNPDLVVIEFPELWSGNSTSHASTASGDLFKLAYLVGALAMSSSRYVTALPVLVTPGEWKGQLSKDMVLERLADYGITAKNHEADAIGMGIAAQDAL